MVTSPVASRLPSLSSHASARRSRGAALRKKLMLRLMVTASGTGPMAASTATYMAKSASAIIVGPEIVPPGRTDLAHPATALPHGFNAKPAVGMENLRKLAAKKALELLDRHRDRHAPPSRRDRTRRLRANE